MRTSEGKVIAAPPAVGTIPDDRSGRRMGIAVTVSIAANVLLLQAAGAMSHKTNLQMPPSEQAPSDKPVTIIFKHKIPQELKETPVPVPPKEVIKTVPLTHLRPVPTPEPLPTPSKAIEHMSAPARTQADTQEANNAPAPPPASAATIASITPPSAQDRPANDSQPAKFARETPVGDMKILPGTPEEAAPQPESAPRTANAVTVRGPRSSTLSKLDSGLTTSLRSANAAVPAQVSPGEMILAPAHNSAVARTGIVGAMSSSEGKFAAAAGPEIQTSAPLTTHAIFSHPVRPGLLSRSFAAIGERGSTNAQLMSAVTPGTAGSVRVATFTSASAAASAVALNGNVPAAFQTSSSPEATLATSSSQRNSVVAPTGSTGHPRARPGAASGLSGKESAVDVASLADVKFKGSLSDESRYASGSTVLHSNVNSKALSSKSSETVKRDEQVATAAPQKQQLDTYTPVQPPIVGPSEFEGTPAGSVRSARLVEFTQPDVPESLRRTKIAVRIQAKVTVYASGQRRAEIVHGSGYPELDHAIIAALNASRYESALLSGKEVDSVLPVTIPFANN